MNILNAFGSDLYSGHRVIRVNSFEEFEDMEIPVDCEIIAINKNPEINECYMKQRDSLGNRVCERYELKAIPKKKLNPDEYVTKEELNDLRKEIKDGFNSIKQSFTALSTSTGTSGNNAKSSSSSK